MDGVTSQSASEIPTGGSVPARERVNRTSMGFPTLGTIGTWTITETGNTIKVNVGNPVPGPLPLLGAAAAFGLSRRLQRRVAVRESLGES